MKNISYIYICLILIVVSLFSGCETLEDTYKDYAGNGKIRYVGKCTNLEVKTGWKRFVFKWDNSEDQAIENIKIFWTADGKADSVLLPAGTTSYETDAIFENASYTFSICAVDKKGNSSYPMVYYGRPYTYEHEAITGYTTLVKKHFFVGDKLIIILDDYNPNVSSSKITYYEAGVAKDVNLIETVFVDKYLVLNNVDKTKPVTLSRVAQVDGCIDLVTFTPYEFKRDAFAMNRDFMLQVKERYNLKDINSDFINTTQELDLNYSLASLEDILYFPNLKKINLGSGRYIRADFIDYMTSESKSVLEDKELSLFALQKAHEILGVNVDIYNDHYDLLSQLNFAENKGNPILPPLNYLETTGWSVTWKPGREGFDSHPSAILDNNPETYWKPNSEWEMIRSHELIIDMKELKEIKGVKITQTTTDWEYAKYYPKHIHIQTSKSGSNWDEAFYQLESNLGNSSAESTVLYFPKTTSAKYVKIILPDMVFPWERLTCLADFMIF